MADSLQRFKAELFKALAHPTRIRILELLREGEKSVGVLQDALSVDGSVVSQQLSVLRMKNLVDTRRQGTTIYYSLRDSQVNELLDIARHIFEAHVIQLQAMADSDETQPSATVARR